MVGSKKVLGHAFLAVAFLAVLTFSLLMTSTARAGGFQPAPEYPPPREPLAVNAPSVLPSVTITVTPASVAEDAPLADLDFYFARTGSTAQPLTVTFDVGGTAIFNTDYTEAGAATFSGTSGTITFPVGSALVHLEISPVGDVTVEPDETVIITLTTSGSYIVGNPGVATGTIQNDDSATVTLSGGTAQAEGDS
ncbi:MAG: hypothetical protein D6791_10720, partial [Chloroflexi bacterium]